MTDELLRRRAEEVAYVENGDRVALLRLDALDQAPILLEGTSATIWRLLDGTRTHPQLLEELAGKYAAPAASLAGDVEAFLRGLRNLGLLETP